MVYCVFQLPLAVYESVGMRPWLIRDFYRYLVVVGNCCEWKLSMHVFELLVYHIIAPEVAGMVYYSWFRLILNIGVRF